jgi:hypothetical protein
LELPLAVQWGFAPDGRLICTGLLVGWDPEEPAEVTSRALRRIKLSEIMADLPNLPDKAPSALGRRSIKSLIEAAPKARPAHPGPQGWPDEHYQEVARLYRAGLVKAPRSPMKWLAAQLDTSEPTAYRWRDEAVNRGLLEPRPKKRRGPARQTRRQPATRKGSR